MIFPNIDLVSFDPTWIRTGNELIRLRALLRRCSARLALLVRPRAVKPRCRVVGYTERRMTELLFDHPVPEMLEDADAAALVAIDEGLTQLDAGQGIPLSELRAEFARRCAR